MAFIHKAIVYFIDPNEEFETVKDIAEEMDNCDSLLHMKISKAETKAFDWDDGVIVNRIDCTGDQAEQFFQTVPAKKIIPTFWYRVILNDKEVEDVKFLNSYREAFYQKVYESSNVSVLDGSSKPLYYVDVEAEGPNQAEEIAKEKVLDYIENKSRQSLNDLRRRYFN